MKKVTFTLKIIIGGHKMNPIVKQWVNHKINNLTPEDLIKLGLVYNISLTKEQAKKTIAILGKENVDIGNKIQVNRLLKQIGKEINKDMEEKIRYLLEVLL